VIESESTFARTLGLQSDIVLKEMYQVNATASSGAEDSKHKMVLRPEGTAGVLRCLLNDTAVTKDINKEQTKVWYWGPMFRHERPQAGRLRQFY